MAVWALFGIELISGHTKDVVALHAHAVNVGLRWLRGRLFWFSGMFCRRTGNVWHDGGHCITRGRRIRRNFEGLDGHHKGKKARRELSREWSNLLIDFKLDASAPSNRPVSSTNLRGLWTHGRKRGGCSLLMRNKDKIT